MHRSDFTDQLNLVFDSQVHLSLHHYFYHQITYYRLNLLLNVHLHMNGKYGIINIPFPIELKKNLFKLTGINC